MDLYIPALVWAFQCSACQELLFEPITLPCGASVCKRCFRRPSCSAPSSSAQNDSKEPSAGAEAVAEATAAVACVGAYNCPAKTCGLKHRFRCERPDILLTLCLEKFFPVEMNAQTLAKAGEERLNVYWSPDQSMCKDDSCLLPSSGDTTKRNDLLDIIASHLDPAIQMAPHLQMPFILRAKAFAELGFFDDALTDANHADRLNPLNRRGLIAEKLVSWRQRMYESELHLLATCAITALESARTESGQCSLDTPAFEVFPNTVKNAASQLKDQVKAALATRPEVPPLLPGQMTCVPEQPLSLLHAAHTFESRLLEKSQADGYTTFEEVMASVVPVEEFECHMCMAILSSPVTTPCGHTWCRCCLLKSLDHSNSCPMCRAKLPGIGYFLPRPNNRSLAFVLKQAYSHAYETREPEIFETKEILPLFICSLLFPGSTTSFHMFEPRYRVMIKRCIESSRRFAITLPRPPNSAGQLPCMEYGTIVQIKHFEPLVNCDIVATLEGNLPRYMVEVTGLHRVRILNVETDAAGYNTAQVERLEDIEPEDRVDKVPAQEWYPQELATYVYKARQFVSSILTPLPPPARLHFERQHGRMPDDPSDLSFWLGEFLPLNPYALYDLLPMTCLTKRLGMLCGWIEKTIVKSQ